jgi:endonuclease III-like uncharacterized protein
MNGTKRQTILFVDTDWRRLKSLAEHYGAYQWEIVNALIRTANTNDPNIETAISELREFKRQEKKRNKALARKIVEISDGISPEELDAVLAHIRKKASVI